MECVQTDNDFEFTNRFSNSKRDIPTLFEKTTAELSSRHKWIRPYTPRHNSKVEHSHREDQKRFYSTHVFFSPEDFGKQLAVHNRRSQQPTDAATYLAFSKRVPSPICLTILHLKYAGGVAPWTPPTFS